MFEETRAFISKTKRESSKQKKGRVTEFSM